MMKAGKTFFWCSLSRWTDFIATFQTLLSILFVFHLLRELGVLPFSTWIYSVEFEDKSATMEHVAMGSLNMTCTILLLILHLMGGAMALLLQDGAREANIEYIRKWINFALLSLTTTILIDVIQYESVFQALDLAHIIGLCVIILIQGSCILIVRLHELELSSEETQDILKV